MIPVLDLQHGRAVHARGGERAVYAPVESRLAPGSGDTLALAHAYVQQLGVRELYVADLDAITGAALQRELLLAIAALGAHLWVDAGLSTAEGARLARSAGAERVIVGLETLPSFRALADVARAVGGDARVAFSLDLRAGAPIVRADASLGGTPASLAARAVDAGACAVIVLDLVRVGTSGGPDLALIEQIRRAVPQAELVAGGGVRDPEDLQRLAGAGCDAALVATALHTGRVTRADIEAIGL